MRSLLQIAPKNDEALIRQVWSNAVHYAGRASASPVAPPVVAPVVEVAEAPIVGELEQVVEQGTQPPLIAAIAALLAEFNKCVRGGAAWNDPGIKNVAKPFKPAQLDVLADKLRDFAKTQGIVEKEARANWSPADRILSAICAAGDAGLTKAEIFTNGRCRNMAASALNEILQQLQCQGLATRMPPAAGGRGRPSERWAATLPFAPSGE